MPLIQFHEMRHPFLGSPLPRVGGQPGAGERRVCLIPPRHISRMMAGLGQPKAVYAERQR